MIAVDTNIIIRLLTADDRKQHRQALDIFNKHNIFIPDTVVLETEWVLRYAYEFSPADVCTALRKLFGLHNVNLSNPSAIAQALDWHQSGLDFSDALHLSQCQQHEQLLTFDKSFARRAKGLTNCAVEIP